MNKSSKASLIILTFTAILAVFIFQLKPYLLWQNEGDTEASTNQEMEISYPISAWSWQTAHDYTPETAATLAKQLTNAHVSTVYVDISEAADLMEAQDKTGIAEFSQKLKDFVAALSAENINVQGLTGAKNWADPEYHFYSKYTVDFVSEYNKNAKPEEQLTGIHFDIEPHGQESFNDDKETALLNLIELIHKTTGWLNNQNKQSFSTSNPKQLELGYDLAYWYDGQNKNISEIEWNGKKAFPFYHIADELEKYGNGYITLMAYRNFARGNNGTIALVKNEIDYTKNKSVRIIVGQELNPNEEDAEVVTFYGMSKNELLAELYRINEAYKYENNFQGFALHEVKSLLPYFN